MKNDTFYTNMLQMMMSEGTIEYRQKDSSSLQASTIIFFREDNKEDTIVPKKQDTSTKRLNDKSISSLERTVARQNFYENEVEKDKLVQRLINELESALELFDEENENFSSSEKKIIEIEHKYNMRILGEVIQTVYVRHFDNPTFLVGICKSLLRYDLDEVRPWGAAMLTGFLNHPDERVKEYTVQLIDNWCDLELLPILKTIQVTSKWLKDYIDDVVAELENTNVLY
ncbi:MAG: hypothetical protein NC407_09850 [Lachnoclostridium sp.]|nr:hypothetical protein [Lachnoclostridium sp.]